MRRFIIASHGNYAKGIVEALSLIAGTYGNVHVISAYVDGKQSGDSIKEVEALVENNPTDEYLIMTDLLGGSVNTELMQCISKENIHLVAGINLVFLLTVITASEDEEIIELIHRAIEDSKMGIAYCNELEAITTDEF